MTDQWELKEQVLGREITAKITRLDNGIAVLLTGGETTHVGAVVCAGPEGGGEIALEGHKENIVCRQWANRLADAAGTQVWVAGGIHYDRLSQDGLEQVLQSCGRLLEKAAALLTPSASERAPAKEL